MTMDNQKEEFRARRKAALYGLAVCDALGAPLEFQARRKDVSEYLRDMAPNYNFSLPPGHFTDDTSMALCLATSLAISGGKHDAVDQANRYVMWLDNGYMSSVEGHAFDVGNQTRQALQYWRKTPVVTTQVFIRTKFDEEWRGGNGSLMRVLPCALVATNADEAVELAKKSSMVTHPHKLCVDCCAVYSLLIFHALHGAAKDGLHGYLTQFLEQCDVNEDLRNRLKQYPAVEDFGKKPRAAISSSGYVLDSLEAAVWTFFTTESFEHGAIEVVNLGDDADTVGAIYGGLAGAFYGSLNEIPQRWMTEMKQVCLLDDVLERIEDVFTAKEK